MGINGFTQQEVFQMEAERQALLDEIRQLRETNDALKSAGGRVLMACSQMELEYAYEALHKAINPESA